MIVTQCNTWYHYYCNLSFFNFLLLWFYAEKPIWEHINKVCMYVCVYTPYYLILYKFIYYILHII